MAEADENDCPICFDSSDLRVLRCGHCFCIECLVSLHQRHDGKIPCPMDREMDETSLCLLPKPGEFCGKIFMQVAENTERFNNITDLLDDQIKQRFKTILGLRFVGNSLKNQQIRCESAKIGGSVTGVCFCIFPFGELLQGRRSGGASAPPALC